MDSEMGQVQQSLGQIVLGVTAGSIRRQPLKKRVSETQLAAKADEGEVVLQGRHGPVGRHPRLEGLAQDGAQAQDAGNRLVQVAVLGGEILLDGGSEK